MRDAREGMSDYGGWQALALAQTRVQRREHDESSQSAMPPCCWAFRRAGLANCPPVSRTRRVPPALHRHEWISMLQSAGFGSRRLRPPARCTPRTGCAEHPGTSATTPAAGPLRSAGSGPHARARSPRTALAASERCHAAAGSARPRYGTAWRSTTPATVRPPRGSCRGLTARGGRSLPGARSHSSRSRHYCAWLLHSW